MKDASRNLWVGLFVVVSFGALGVLMVWFGEAPAWLGTADWTLEITGVRDLSGVGDGSPVTLNGVEIGRVQGLDFEDPERPDQGVVIIARIEKKYSIPRGAQAKVYGAMLGIGSGRVAIVVEPGARADPLPTTGASIPGEMSSVLGEVISKGMIDSVVRSVTHVGDLTREWTPVGTNLARLLEQRTVEQVSRPGAAERGMSPNVSTVVERLDNLVRHINVVLGDGNVQGDLRGVAQDLKDASTEVKALVELWKRESQRISDRLAEGLEHTDENLNQSLTRLIAVLDNLDEAAKSLAAVGHHLTQGEGTVGRLLYDDRLYEAGVLALTRLSDVLGRLDRITGKIEEDGHITIAQTTPLGTFKEDFPVGSTESGAK